MPEGDQPDAPAGRSSPPRPHRLSPPAAIPLIDLWPAEPSAYTRRVHNGLRRAGHATAADLTGCTAGDVLALPNVGPVQLGIVRAALAARGLALRGETTAGTVTRT